MSVVTNTAFSSTWFKFLSFNKKLLVSLISDILEPIIDCKWLSRNSEDFLLVGPLFDIKRWPGTLTKRF